MILLIIVVIIVITYFLGPSPPNPTYDNCFPELIRDLNELQVKLSQEENQKPIRKDNQARILCYNDSVQKTEFSIVYLHGFTGSYRDGFPLNVNIAKHIGANIFLNRMVGHGLKPPHNLVDFSPENAWHNAKEALAIGQALGDKVIIMSTSTGGTLATKLAAEFPDKVYALINISPNFKDNQFGAFLLNTNWGYEIAKLVSFGSHKKINHEEPLARKYWDTVYTSKVLVDLQVLVQSTMKPPTFNKVRCPVLTLYYQDNEFEEDTHVEVDIYPEIHDQFRTPEEFKSLVRLETPRTHFLGSDIKSEDIESVEKEILSFLNQKLSIPLKD